MSTTYTARATRERRWWTVSVPAIDGMTQARRLSDVKDMARELVAVTLNVPIDQVEIEVTVGAVDDIDVQAALDLIRDERAEAARLERDASERARELARALIAHDVPLRDVGAALGVSHQRAHQLVRG